MPKPLVVQARDAQEEGAVFFGVLGVVVPLEGIGLDVGAAEPEEKEFVEAGQGFVAEALLGCCGFLDRVFLFLPSVASNENGVGAAGPGLEEEDGLVKAAIGVREVYGLDID
jgi:hypothetical protein